MADKADSKPQSIFFDHIYTNTDEKPEIIYNACAYAAIFNRVKGALMNQMPNADSSSFDRTVQEHIRSKLSGSRAEVEEWLDSLGFKGMFKMYDDGVINADTRKQIKSEDYDYMCSVDNFVRNMDKYVAKAKYLTGVKYSSQKDGPPMLTIPDIIEVLNVKRGKSDFAFFTSNKSLINNVGGYSADGKNAGGPIVQAMNNAYAQAKGFKTNRRMNFWKAVGWGALTIGAGVLTGGLGIATLGIGGQALGGLFGALYSTGLAGFFAGAVATVGLGSATFTALGKFVGRIQQNIKNRIKERNFLLSKGKHAEAAEDDWKNMGYKRLKMKRDEALAIDCFYKNYEDGKPVRKRKDGKYKPLDYVPRKYRKAFMRYVEGEVKKHGPKARTDKTLFSNAKHHRFVHAQADTFKENEVGFYKLEAIIRTGSYESYLPSDLTADEAVINYGTGEDPKTHVKSRLHADMIKEHSGYENSLQYIDGNLREFVSHEQKFNDARLQSEYVKGLKVFVNAYDEAFNKSLFENAYTPTMIGDASNTMQSDEFQKMIKVTNSGESEAHLKSVLGFLAAERDNISEREPKQLTDSVGVGVEYQINMSENSLIAGCKSLGDETDVAKEAAKAVAEMTTCSSDFVGGKLVCRADAAVVAKIAATSGSTKKYLEHMLEVKLAQTQIKSNATLAAEGSPVTDILSKIYALKKSEKASKIRSEISEKLKDEDTDTDDVKLRKKVLREQLSDVLDAQVLSLETKIRDDSRVDAIAGIKAGSTRFAALIEDIKKIEKIEIDKLQEMMHRIEMEAERPELIEYLKLKLKDKVAHELKHFALNNDNFAKGKSEDNLKELMAFISRVGSLISSQILDQWQLDEIMSILSKQIERTMNAYLYDVERLFLEDTDEKINALNLLITGNAKDGIGLKEFFDMQTPESIEIKNKADRYRQALAVRQFMTVTSTGSYGGFVDSKSGDIQAALNVYFAKFRGSTDNLRNIFVKFNANIDQLDYNQDIDFISALPEKDSTEMVVFADGSSVACPTFKGFDTCKKIIGGGNLTLPDARYSFIMTTIESLKSDSFKNSTAEERLAALTVLKRKIAGMMRVQMIQLFQKKGSGDANYNDFYNHHRTDLNNNLINGWKELAELVDVLIVSAKDSLSADSMIAATVEPNTVAVVNSICQPSKYSTIVNQQQMMG